MTPREELLAAVAEINRVIALETLDSVAYPVIRDWLQLEADQHWHPGEGAVLAGNGVFNKWEQPWWTEEMLMLQPCIQMARLINGTEGS